MAYIHDTNEFPGTKKPVSIEQQIAVLQGQQKVFFEIIEIMFAALTRIACDDTHSDDLDGAEAVEFKWDAEETLGKVNRILSEGVQPNA
jgi:hypothetical protein